MAGGKHSHPECHLIASGGAAVVNFPLWKASAIGQSGFDKQSYKQTSFLGRYECDDTLLFDTEKPPILRP